MSEAEVRAAGGVVHRRGEDGTLEVLLVHRPRYDDWTLPKGKLEPGEDDEQAALREVAEETGLRCELGGELLARRYRDGQGREKLVRYWSMRPLDGAFRPHAEVDRIRWLPLAAAESALTYEGDREVLRSLAPDVG